VTVLLVSKRRPRFIESNTTTRRFAQTVPTREPRHFSRMGADLVRTVLSRGVLSLSTGTNRNLRSSALARWSSSINAPSCQIELKSSLSSKDHGRRTFSAPISSIHGCRRPLTHARYSKSPLSSAGVSSPPARLMLMHGCPLYALILLEVAALIWPGRAVFWPW
jgi:hypothetical protein